MELEEGMKKVNEEILSFTRVLGIQCHLQLLGTVGSQLVQ